MKTLENLMVFLMFFGGIETQLWGKNRLKENNIGEILVLPLEQNFNFITNNWAKVFKNEPSKIC